MISDGIDKNLSLFKGRADTAVVLGSGLAPVEDLVKREEVVSYADIRGLSPPTVSGHPGRLSLCRVKDEFLLLFTGRLHVYEGLDFEEAGYVVDLASEMGCRRILLTHAAGGLHTGVSKMSWMLPSDIVSFPYGLFHCTGPAGAAPGSAGRGFFNSCHSPPEDVRSSGFPSRGSLISKGFRIDIGRAAAGAGISIRDGVLFWSSGPPFETCSEANAALEIGADCATMSCLPELMAAYRLGMEAACLSWITNHTVNVTGGATRHDEVIGAGKTGADNLFRILCVLGSGSRRKS